MTVTPKISINNGNLIAHGRTICTGAFDNIVLTPGSVVGLSLVLIGASALDSKSLHVFPMGDIINLNMVILLCTRSSIHVSVPIQTMVDDSKNGTCGRDVPLNIQFMLFESKDNTEGTEQGSLEFGSDQSSAKRADKLDQIRLISGLGLVNLLNKSSLAKYFILIYELRRSWLVCNSTCFPRLGH
ncbi:Glycosyl hydrolases 36 [Dillenia turbinata]|uniref:Glycosyl hydrolases 36 n=1 Tax=Dillenia turbinata TaxID=194707 RepID=A0AAN8WBQ8_9MAGN